MRAAICYEFGKPLVVEEVDLVPTERDEVRVRIHATTLCHSDVHVVRGELEGRLGNAPIVTGHESAGYVEEVGENVTSVRPGDPVLVSVLRSCGECKYCKTGLPHLCLFKRAPDKENVIINKRGQSIERLEKVGGFAEYVVVHKSQVVKLPKDMPLDRASLLACGVSTGFGAVVYRAKVEPHSSVVVIGVGGVGINAIQGARFAGAHPIIAVDISDEKLETAAAFGATHMFNANQEDVVDAVKKLVPTGDGADYVFVAVGNVNVIRQGFMMTGGRGMTVMIGVPPLDNSDITFSVFDFISRERVLTSGYMGATNLSVHIPQLVALYQSGRLKLDELITNRYPLEEINEAIESLERGEVIRNVIMI